MRLRSIVVILLVLLAGCTAPQADEPPAPAGTDVSVTLSNEHTATYTVTVHAIPPDAEGIELTYENGSTRTFDGPIEDLPSDWPRNVTALSVDGNDRYAETVRLAPNRGVGLTLEAVPPGSAVVYIVHSEAGPRATHGPGIVQCGPNNGSADLTVRILADGSLDSRLSCAGDMAVS
ncbi:hypothetical protein [Halohasta salina]|uniref:hypothetical protein n=1 Tax=Halohasta salina TaxID=2961621 RepID=UPI0020A33F05|nr:hypothetical protein [Halohasta salina]